jgi:hypothetical protein
MIARPALLVWFVTNCVMAFLPLHLSGQKFLQTTSSTRVRRQTRVNNNNDDQRIAGTSALVGTKTKLKLDIGREQGTWMPSIWASSGARLQVNVEVEFTNEAVITNEAAVDDFVGPAASSRDL